MPRRKVLPGFLRTWGVDGKTATASEGLRGNLSLPASASGQDLLTKSSNMADTPGIVKFPAALDSADSLIQAGNGLVTTLTAGIIAGQLSFGVVNATNWPATGIATIQKRIAATVGAETVYLPTGMLEIVNFERSGNTLTVTRGQQGTADVPHDAGDYIECRITALHHETLKTAILAVETYLFALSGKFVFGETPTGSINGSNATFTSQFNFVPESVVVLVNGLEQRRVTDFNTSGTQTIILADAPQVGESVRINYVIP